MAVIKENTIKKKQLKHENILNCILKFETFCWKYLRYQTYLLLRRNVATKNCRHEELSYNYCDTLTLLFFCNQKNERNWKLNSDTFLASIQHIFGLKFKKRPQKLNYHKN